MPRRILHVVACRPCRRRPLVARLAAPLARFLGFFGGASPPGAVSAAVAYMYMYDAKPSCVVAAGVSTPPPLPPPSSVACTPVVSSMSSIASVPSASPSPSLSAAPLLQSHASRHRRRRRARGCRCRHSYRRWWHRVRLHPRPRRKRLHRRHRVRRCRRRGREPAYPRLRSVSSSAPDMMVWVMSLPSCDTESPCGPA